MDMKIPGALSAAQELAWAKRQLWEQLVNTPAALRAVRTLAEVTSSDGVAFLASCEAELQSTPFKIKVMENDAVVIESSAESGQGGDGRGDPHCRFSIAFDEDGLFNPLGLSVPAWIAADLSAPRRVGMYFHHFKDAFAWGSATPTGQETNG